MNWKSRNTVNITLWKNLLIENNNLHSLTYHHWSQQILFFFSSFLLLSVYLSTVFVRFFTNRFKNKIKNTLNRKTLYRLFLFRGLLVKILILCVYKYAFSECHPLSSSEVSPRQSLQRMRPCLPPTQLSGACRPRWLLQPALCGGMHLWPWSRPQWRQMCSAQRVWLYWWGRKVSACKCTG